MRHSSWGIFWTTLLFLVVCVIPTQAQTASADFQAVIVAPRSVELANTGAITILVYLHRLHGHQGRPKPSKILLETSQGRWLKDSVTPPDPNNRFSPQEAEVDTFYDFCTATLLLADLPVYSSLRLNVLTAKDHPGDQSQSLGSQEITLHYPATIKFGMVPQTIPADGKTRGEISLHLLNEAGQGIKNESLLLQGYGPQNQDGTEIVVPAITDGNGYAVFVLPASSHSGRCFLDVMGPGIFEHPISTWLLEVDYVENVGQFVKPLQMDRFWWRHPYRIGIGGE